MMIMAMLHLALQVAGVAASTTPAQIARPNCPEKCGNITVPYPFGIGSNCYYKHPQYPANYSLKCNHTTHPPSLTYQSDIKVLKITLDGEFRVEANISYGCYKKNGTRYASQSSFMDNKLFPLSTTQNSLIAIGCDSFAWFKGRVMHNRKVEFQAGCMAVCNNQTDVGKSCSGIGCCKSIIPSGVIYFNITAKSFNNQTLVHAFNPCSVAFVVANDGFHSPLLFISRNESYLQNVKLALIYDWSIAYRSCKSLLNSTIDLICQGNSRCVDLPADLGYRCQCNPGFEGNPYLQDCQDIDECKKANDCEKDKYCINTIGGYYCKCPKGHHGSGTRTDGCIPYPKTYWLVPVFVSAGLSLVPVGWWLYSDIKRRQAIKQRAKHFERNGGMLLQQQISSDESVVDRIKIFTIKELQKATDHFNDDRILGQGGHGTVYKGMLGEGKIVAVKKSNKLEESEQTELFINEVIILSQINHRNILKLLGCCLETEVPLLVYEFIPNGTLYHHIHNPSEEFQITWKMRLQIASDSAGALAYLHSSSSTLIFHRDIKSSNILLDDKYRAKLSDFGISRAVAIDQTRVVTRVMGTFGYMDPEYFHSHQFTDKSDVYSFGMVIVELLTGQKAIRAASEQDRSLASWFLTHLENSCLFDIIDSQVLQEGSKEEFLTIANLAKRCLNLDGKSRPTMKEVLLEIEMVLSLYTVKTKDLTNKPNCAQSELMFAGTTSTEYGSTFYLENSASSSAEASLLFNAR